MTYRENVKRLGMSVWLLFLYTAYTSDDLEGTCWAPVCKGVPIHDFASANTLGVSVKKAVNWRNRLERFGAITTKNKGEEGFVIYVKDRRRLFAGLKFENPNSETDWPPMQTTITQ